LGSGWEAAPAPRGSSGGLPDLRATQVHVTRAGTHMRVTLADGRSLPVRLPWLGAHFATSVLFAFAVGQRFGMRPEAIAARLGTTPPVAGRLNPLPGRGGSLILDDSYNASPAAVQAALRVLRGLRAEGVGEVDSAADPTVRIAVLGDMAELGETSVSAHRAVGHDVAQGIDLLVTRGEEAAAIAEGAREAGMEPERVVVTYRAEDAVAAIEPHLGPETIVLVKGSAVTRMEQVVAALMSAPEHAARQLVRQDAAWRQIVVLRPDRPTWLEIDLGAVADNTRHLKALAEPAALMAVIKADAYGHGGLQVAQTVLHNGAAWLGVACLPEGAALRRAGIDAPILVLGYTPAWQARDALRLGLDVAVCDLDTALAFSRAAEALDRPARVHVKVDTGLHRLGLAPEAVPEFLGQLRSLTGLEIVGLFTHFAVADDRSAEGRMATDAQLAAFDALLRELDAAGLRPPWVHAANSAALLTRPESRYDLVRPGIALYGLDPSPDVQDPALRPALAWKTQVAQVRDLAPGEAVGYGHTWRAERPSRVATIPVGYADGFRRAPRRWRHVLLRGRPAPLVGRVSMDQATVDVTEVPGVRQGDEVVLIGRQGEAEIRAEEVAAWLGTIHYEVVSAILARVARVS
jgi:alanine racemase